MEIFDPEIHKQRLGPGAVLSARDELQDPNFNETIVLLCRHGADEGAYGLVLNRPAHMPLSEVFEHAPESALAAGGNRRIYVGGPVQPTELQILQVSTEPVPGSLAIASGVHLGGTWSDLEEILDRPARNLRLFLGYSGWGEGQLEREIDAGAWEVWNVDAERLLMGPEEAWFGGAEKFRRFLASF